MGDSRNNNDLLFWKTIYSQAVSKCMFSSFILTVELSSFKSHRSPGQYDQTCVLTSWHMAEATQIIACWNVMECQRLSFDQCHISGGLDRFELFCLFSQTNTFICVEISASVNSI